MSCQVDTIKTAYEILGLTPEQISEAQDGLTVTAVKAALMSASAKYRKDIGVTSVDNDESRELDFTDEELRDVNQIIKECAKEATLSDGTPDYRTRLAAATYIRDDKKGRKNPVKQMGNQFNIFSFNESIKQMREAKSRIITEIGGIAQPS